MRPLELVPFPSVFPSDDAVGPPLLLRLGLDDEEDEEIEDCCWGDDPDRTRPPLDTPKSPAAFPRSTS